MYFVSICIYIFIIISYNIFILSAVIYIIGNILFTHLLVILYTLDIKNMNILIRIYQNNF